MQGSALPTIAQQNFRMAYASCPPIVIQHSTILYANNSTRRAKKGADEKVRLQLRSMKAPGLKVVCHWTTYQENSHFVIIIEIHHVMGVALLMTAKHPGCTTETTD